MLFMKGNRVFPQCGFSNTAVQVLGALGVEYETYDILEDGAVREQGEYLMSRGSVGWMELACSTE